jgi:hypothetical protein
MGRLDTIGSRPKSSVAATATAVGLCTVLALAHAPAEAADKVAPALILPSLKGPGSLTGVWNSVGLKDQGTSSPVGAPPAIHTADGQPIPYQPEIAKSLAQQGDNKGKAIDAQSAPWCVPSGMPTMMDPPRDLPLQLLETPRQVTVVFGDFGTYRIIRLNEKHPPDPDPTYFGNSVGHWEGGTLVVDTTALLDKTTLFGAPHSEDMHLVERFHRIDEDTLEDRISITDPKTYTRPWTWIITLKRVPGTRLKEYERRPC